VRVVGDGAHNFGGALELGGHGRKVANQPASGRRYRARRTLWTRCERSFVFLRFGFEMMNVPEPALRELQSFFLPSDIIRFPFTKSLKNKQTA
jgi:hypothetical protein